LRRKTNEIGEESKIREVLGFEFLRERGKEKREGGERAGGGAILRS